MMGAAVSHQKKKKRPVASPTFLGGESYVRRRGGHIEGRTDAVLTIWLALSPSGRIADGPADDLVEHDDQA